MPWTITSDGNDFLAAAGPFLTARPIENTVLLTVAGSLASGRRFGGTQPLLGWWRATDDDEVTGAFVCTSPYPLVLSRTPAAAVTALATRLVGHPLGGVTATPDGAAAFADEWGRRTGAVVEPGRTNRLYRLDRLTPPAGAVPGTARVAGAADRELLVAWFEAFQADIGEQPRGVAAAVDDRIGYGGLTLWEIDGVPVSMGGSTRPVGGMARVAPIYTPPQLRGRGYGAAVTTAVTQGLQDAGVAEIVLFTDLANPTSNALYQRLGYRTVSDRHSLAFTR